MGFLVQRLRLYLLLSVLVVGNILSCSSMPQSQALRRVRVGMTKSEVLDIVGNPTRTDRRHGQDRWTYEPPPHEGSDTGYVFFSEGLVTYVGDSKAPEAADAPSAAPPMNAAPAAHPNSGFRPLDGESQ